MCFRSTHHLLPTFRAPVVGDEHWPSARKLKRREMRESDARFVAVFHSGSVAAFLHYRFLVEEEDAVVYIYELQVSSTHKRKGLGKFLVCLAECLGRKFNAKVGADAAARLSKVMLTVHHTNTSARAFYERLKYRMDDISPSLTDPEGFAEDEYDYDILSKIL